VLSEKGYVTVAMDVGQHEVYEKGRILMGERLWDVMRCVDYVASFWITSIPSVSAARDCRWVVR